MKSNEFSQKVLIQILLACYDEFGDGFKVELKPTIKEIQYLSESSIHYFPISATCSKYGKISLGFVTEDGGELAVGVNFLESDKFDENELIAPEEAFYKNIAKRGCGISKPSEYRRAFA